MNLKFISIWTNAINQYMIRQLRVPKTIIVNLEDLNDYERYLEEIYPNGIIPLEGCLRFKNIPIGFSKELHRNECTLEE